MRVCALFNAINKFLLLFTPTCEPTLKCQVQAQEKKSYVTFLSLRFLKAALGGHSTDKIFQLTTNYSLPCTLSLNCPQSLSKLHSDEDINN